MLIPGWPTEEVYVQPGESHFVSAPTTMRTLLGSCVGVTFWCDRLGIAALCHAMLPASPKCPKSALSLSAGRRYVDLTIRELAQRFDASGAARSEVQVKVFGGADVLPVHQRHTRATVGQLNCEAAFSALEHEGFCVVASSLRGISGLTMYFNTSTGEVLLQRFG